MEEKNISGDSIGFGKGVLTPANINKIAAELESFEKAIKNNIIISVAREKTIRALEADIYKFKYDILTDPSNIIRNAEKHLHNFIVLTELTEINTPERTQLIESLHGDRMLLKGMF